MCILIYGLVYTAEYEYGGERGREVGGGGVVGGGREGSETK